LSFFLLPALLAAPMAARAAEVCTTQSAMQPADRSALAAAAEVLARKIQTNDTAGVKALTIPEFQNDFTGMSNEIAVTAPKVAGAQAQVEQLYLLDATTLVKTASGANPDAQFFCTLNKSTNEAGFSIPQLPPGKYAFAMVRMDAANPYRISMLLRQDGGRWLLAGLYPKPLTAEGHDGLWFWKQARALDAGTGAAKEPWSAWLYYQEAQMLLLPANFVSSTHLEKLRDEVSTAVPPAISGGLSADTPLVVKGADNTEFRFTSLAPDDSLGPDKMDVAAHIKVDALTDANAARQRNVAAATALLAAHPELRRNFHGVWIFADAPNQNSFSTELAMAEIK
jgi:hypothetical protein